MAKDPEYFELFQKAFTTYQAKFGLTGYKVYFEYGFLDDDDFGAVSVDLVNMTATVRLNSGLSKGWFWKLPLRLNEVSYVWEHCCSYKCYGLQLEKMLKALATDSREVLDLADFLFSSVCKFITVEQVTENLDRIKTTEWAKSLIAAGYRKVGPSDNPYNFWHSRDGLGLE